MDDPWGSPWEAPDTDKDQKQLSPTKSDIALPPRAFLSASNSPRIPAAPEQSPWGGDDDNFGDWATTSETPPAHSVWAGSWGGSSPNLAVTPRDDFLNKTSPIAWPVSLATPKPSNASSFRQPSPDPWASGFSSRRPSHEAASTPRLVVEAASPVDASPDPLGLGSWGIEEGTMREKTDVSDTFGQSPIEPHESSTADAKHVLEAGFEEQPVSAPDSHVRASVDSVAQNNDYQSSRPSNDNTDHEEERQASPGTSIDEEPRTVRPLSRKEPGKVQELVVKFDGLARAVSEEREPVPRARSRSPLRIDASAGSNEPSDFGDFEEVKQTESPLPSAEPLSAETPPEVPPALDTSPAAFSSPPPENAWASSPIAKFGPLDFPVDFDSLSKLFTAPAESVRASIVNSDVPDHVIRDSFTEISERKTWYRISRLGSSRRHNAGDDDSYRRVAWPSSSVHQDTIKIVRRWMEEDSIAGRVALGGGISKTQRNMFGWDSSAEPVALDAVFGKKTTSHSRAASLQLLPGPGLNGIHSPATNSPQPAVASFGWGSNLPAPSGGQTDEINTQTKPPDATATFSAPPRTSTANDDDDDDDDWGEMVSSPVASQHVASGSSFPVPPTVPVSAAPVSQHMRPVAQDTEDPLSTADFSLLESNPPKPSPFSAEPQSIPVKGPTPALESVILTSVPELPPISAKSYPSSSSEVPSIPPVSDAHEETAQRIISSLPDLSYMLR
ncbi:hypothetical protein N658DRAFT_436128 [Parathielavia hyrcaniae]|uniref:Glucan 1, 4-alpha-glucosidase n=1 Tax=Parathielavia hyrcaniae TaxID=113614 RepID=A0AAN6PW30_9PEZI|nr:hypothetical protein N658DRAFT_436128 [Parathielavia hyrcaniae]